MGNETAQCCSLIAVLLQDKTEMLLSLLCVFVLLSPDSVRRWLLDDPHTFHCNDYLVIEEIRTCQYCGGFLRILVHWICCLLEATNRENHCNPSYPRTQQRDQGAGWTQIIRSRLSGKRLLYSLGQAVDAKAVKVRVANKKYDMRPQRRVQSRTSVETLG